jgi:hypothetical protein
MAQIAPSQCRCLQYLQGVGALTHHGAITPLLHLHPEVESQLAQIGHLELVLHLELELLDLRVVAAGDDQVVDVDANDQSSIAYSLRVHGMLSFTMLEPKLRRRGVQLSVPSVRCLPQAIQRLAQEQHLVLCSINDEPQWFCHKHLLLKIPVEEG